MAPLAQDRTGLRAGHGQAIVDAGLLGLAHLLVPAVMVAWSRLWALVVNLSIVMHHRRDRDIAI